MQSILKNNIVSINGDLVNSNKKINILKLNRLMINCPIPLLGTAPRLYDNSLYNEDSYAAPNINDTYVIKSTIVKIINAGGYLVLFASNGEVWKSNGVWDISYYSQHSIDDETAYFTSMLFNKNKYPNQFSSFSESTPICYFDGYIYIKLPSKFVRIKVSDDTIEELNDGIFITNFDYGHLVVYNNDIYLFGNNGVDKYNVKSNSWESISVNSYQDVRYGGCAVVGNKAYFLLSSPSYNTQFSSNYYYDFNTKSFTSITVRPGTQSSSYFEKVITVIKRGNKLLPIVKYTALYIYDIDENAWTELNGDTISVSIKLHADAVIDESDIDKLSFITVWNNSSAGLYLYYNANFLYV